MGAWRHATTSTTSTTTSTTTTTTTTTNLWQDGENGFGGGGGGGGEGGALDGHNGRPVVPSDDRGEEVGVPPIVILAGKDDAPDELHPRLEGTHASGDGLRILVRRRAYGSDVGVLRRVDGACDLVRVWGWGWC